jgi:hypothetical protein
LKKLFILITPTPKFWRWRNQFYRIGSWFSLIESQIKKIISCNVASLNTKTNLVVQNMGRTFKTLTLKQINSFFANGVESTLIFYTGRLS